MPGAVVVVSTIMRNVAKRMHADEVDVDADLVARLLASQFPEYARLSITVVEPWGTDNAIFRLGADLVVRLPRIAWATAQVDFEAEWLPQLGGHLPVEVPEPVAIGEPGLGYPYRWAIHRWVDGELASLATMRSADEFASDLATTVRGLWALPAGELRAARNRARPIEAYDEPTRRAIAGAAHLIDADAALAIWETALAADPHAGPGVWVHGDLEGNCLTLGGRLHALIDWGSSCAGDPAVDVQTAWSPLFTDASRSIFLEALGVDEHIVARARGAAVNQACAALPYYLDTYPLIVERSRHKLRALGVDTA